MKLCLQVTSGVAAGTEALLLPPGGLLGRTAACALVLGHDSVSSEHAELRFFAGRWLLYPRSRHDRTTADGRPLQLRPVALRPSGDLLLGEVAIQYQQLALDTIQPPPPPPSLASEPDDRSSPSLQLLLAPLLTQPQRTELAPAPVGHPAIELPTLLLSSRSAVPLPPTRPPSLSDIPTHFGPPALRKGRPNPVSARADCPQQIAATGWRRLLRHCYGRVVKTTRLLPLSAI